MSHITLVVALALLITAPPALAAETQTYSGTLAAIDLASHTMTLQEVGPWTGPGTGQVPRAIGLTPSTTFDLVARTPKPAPDGWPGAYVESPLTAADLHPGDFATVKVKRVGKTLTAVSVDVVRPPAKI